MMEIIQFYRSFGSGWTLRCVAVAWLFLLSGAVNVLSQPQEQATLHLSLDSQSRAKCEEAKSTRIK